MAIRRKKNIAGFIDGAGRFRPIRSPQYVGTPKRRATPKDRKKYSKAKAGDLGPVAQEKATGEDFFARIGRKEKEIKDRTWARIEKETLGDADEMDRGRSLVEFVRGQGGIKPGYKFGGKANRGKKISYDAGELAPLTYKESGKRGLVSETGKKSLDNMFKAAREAGYAVGDTWDLLSAMQDEINGGKVTYASSGYMDYRDNPKSDLYVTQLGPRVFGVFLKTYLLKKFATKVAAQKHVASIRSKVKTNPGESWFEIVYQDPKRGTERVTVKARSVSDARRTFVKNIAPMQYGNRSKIDIAALIKSVRKQNPVNIFGVVAGLSGVQSLLQIQEMMKKKPTRRKARPVRKANGKTTAIAKNPATATTSGAKFNETLFDRDLAQIEDGNFRAVRSANAHGRLAGYGKTEIARMVQRARLAFQLKQMYARKGNPADVATLLAPIKNNGAFKRMLSRRKAASALKRELKLEAALNKTRERKRKAIASATANPTTAPAKNPIKVKLWKFYKGQKLATRMIGDNDIVMRGEVISRTPKFVTVQMQGERKPVRCGVNVYGDSETIFPDGKYSMATAFDAKDDDVSRRKNPTRDLVGKKAAARSAKSNPKQTSFQVVGGTGRIVATFATRKQAVEYAKLHPAFKVKAVTVNITTGREQRYGKSNPAKPPRSRTFEMFQGRPVENATRRPVSVHAPAKLAQLGDLIEIKLVGGQILKPNPTRYKLTAANGRLWIAGGKFAKASASAKANEINPVGEIDHVVYGTRKPHHGDHAYTHYIHKLGEESGKRPVLCVDRDGFAVIRGGNYKIEARGIVD